MTNLVFTLPPSIFEYVGIAGFLFYVMNYSLLTLHRVTSQSKIYFVINLLAASCVLTGMTHSFNLASALVQGFWIVISITAIVIRLRPARVAGVTFRSSRGGLA